MTETGCYRLLEVDDDAGGVVESFEPTEYAASGWGPNMQHGGPVSGLLARSIERFARPGTRITRMVVDIVGVVPLTRVRVQSRRVRPGRRVELLAADMQAQDAEGRWRTVASASAWQLETRNSQVVAHHADAAVPFPDFDSPDDSGLDEAWRNGFVEALDWHVASPFGQPGVPTMAWLRLTQPLVLGEQLSDLQRVMTIADVANGVGARLDAREWTYLNTDLSVYLFDAPTGEWIGLQAETSIGRDGIGLSSAVIHTADGPVGRLAQNLLLQPRPQRIP